MLVLRHARTMPHERNRELLSQVVDEVVGTTAQVQWETPGPSWSAHVRLRGAAGRVSHVLTSPEWQEARFEEPRCSAFILTSTDENDVHDALEKLTRAAAEYLAGGGLVEERRGLFGVQRVLVLETVDGEWRIGKRSARHPG